MRNQIFIVDYKYYILFIVLSYTSEQIIYFLLISFWGEITAKNRQLLIRVKGPYNSYLNLYFVSKLLTYFVIIFVSCIGLYGQQKNPLLPCVGKSYGEYHDLFMKHSDTMIKGTLIDQTTLNSWMSEAASLDPTKEWSLLARLNSYRIRSENSLRNAKFLSYSDEYSAEDYISDLVSLSEDGERYGIEPMKIAPLFYIAEALHTYVFDYERTFAYYFTLES